MAVFGGAAVNRYAPDGSLLLTIPLEVKQPTSCAFGGPDRNILFVTSGREGLDQAALARQPNAGRLFAITGLGIGGMPAAPYRGSV